jgi:hypothetical protein
MADDLSVAFERLRTSTQRLNAISDAAAQTVRDVEAYLNGIQPGVEANVPIDDCYDDDERVGSLILGFRGYGQQGMRIVHIFLPKGAKSENDAEIHGWSEGSRDLKLRSFEKLPELLRQIAKGVEEQVAKAEKTVAEITACLPPSKKRKGGDK